MKLINIYPYALAAIGSILVIVILLLLTPGTLSRINPHTSYYDVPSTFLDTDVKQWNDLEDKIRRDNSDVIILKWQGFGGIVLYGLQFIAFIEEMQHEGHKVIFDIIGPSYSLSANTVCYGDSYVIENTGSLNFHGMFTMNGPIKKYIGDDDFIFSKIQTAEFNMCTSKNILSPAQINSIIIDHKMISITNSATKILADE